MYHIIPYEVINVGTWNTVRKLLVVTQGAPGHACSAGLIAPTTSVFASPSSQTRYSNLYGFCVSYSSSAVGLAYSKSLLVRLGLLGSNSSPRLFWSRAAILESCRIIPCDLYIYSILLRSSHSIIGCVVDNPKHSSAFSARDGTLLLFPSQDRWYCAILHQ